MARLHPRFDTQLLLRPYGPLLWRLSRLWSRSSHISAIKVGSHLACIPNGASDHWATRVLDFLEGRQTVGMQISETDIQRRPFFVWPLTFVGTTRRLCDLTVGSLEGHGLAYFSPAQPPRFNLPLNSARYCPFNVHYPCGLGQVTVSWHEYR